MQERQRKVLGGNGGAELGQQLRCKICFRSVSSFANSEYLRATVCECLAPTETQTSNRTNRGAFASPLRRAVGIVVEMLWQLLADETMHSRCAVVCENERAVLVTPGALVWQLLMMLARGTCWRRPEPFQPPSLHLGASFSLPGRSAEKRTRRRATFRTARAFKE